MSECGCKHGPCCAEELAEVKRDLAFARAVLVSAGPLVLRGRNPQPLFEGVTFARPEPATAYPTLYLNPGTMCFPGDAENIKRFERLGMKVEEESK